LRPRGAFSKGEEAGVAWRQGQPPPLLGFLLPLHGRVPKVEGEGGRAAAPRHWEKERVRRRRDAPVEGGAEGRSGGKVIFAARERRAVPGGGRVED
jgi:hypothetical protein